MSKFIFVQISEDKMSFTLIFASITFTTGIYQTEFTTKNMDILLLVTVVMLVTLTRSEIGVKASINDYKIMQLPAFPVKQSPRQSPYLKQWKRVWKSLSVLCQGRTGRS